jgi:hypothetical protein
VRNLDDDDDDDDDDDADDDNRPVFVTVGITNSIAKYCNVFTKGICAGFCVYLAGKVKRTDYNEGN